MSGRDSLEPSHDGPKVLGVTSDQIMVSRQIFLSVTHVDREVSMFS